MKRHVVRYSTIIALASFGSMLTISMIIVSLGFWLGQRNLDAELIREEEHIRHIGELHFRSQSTRLQSFLRILSHDSRLIEHSRRDDWGGISAVLGRSFRELNSGALDILFLQVAGTDRIINVSSGAFDTPDIVRQVVARPRGGTPQLVSSRVAADEIYALVTGYQIIDPDHGAVVGRLYGGIVLNHNPLPLRDLLNNTDLHAVALSINGTIISEIARSAETGLHGQNGFSDVRLAIPFALAPGADATLIVLRGTSPRATLQQTYLRLLPAVIVLIVALSALLAWFLRRVTMRSLSNLTEYAGAVAASVEGHRGVSHFAPGPIRDFNQLGRSIERVFNAFLESEYRAESVINRAPAAIFARDLAGRFLLANDQFLSLFGLDRDQVIGKTGDAFFPESFATELRSFEISTEDLTQEISFETTLPRGSEDRFYIGAMFPLKDDTGQVYALCTILSDITDHKRTEIALRHAKEEAEFANSAKSSFLAGVSHELRTPLNAIIGFSEMIADELLGKIENKNYIEYARHIRSSGAHLLSLIGDVLDLSVIEARKEDMRDETLDLEKLSQDCLSMIGDQAKAKGVEIGVRVNTRGHALRADARRVRQIIINLLSNSVKFTPARGKVGLVISLRDDGRIQILVEDNGSGMDKATLAQAFEPFMRGRSSMVRKAEGAGLGLALVKRLAELHSAELECISAPGEGTTITIIFPYSRTITAPVLRAARR